MGDLVSSLSRAESKDIKNVEGGTTEFILLWCQVFIVFLRTKRDILGVWKFWYWTLWGTIQETLNFKKITEPPGSFKFCSWKKWLKCGLIVWPCDHHRFWFLGSWKAKPNSPVPRNCAGSVSPRYLDFQPEATHFLLLSTSWHPQRT